MKAKLLLIPFVMMALSACMEEGDDLQKWMSETQKSAKPKAPQIFSPSSSIPYINPPNITPNAFSIYRMRADDPTANEDGEQQKRKNSVPAPNTNRPKEILEDFDLANLKFVGIISSANGLSGLVKGMSSDGKDEHVYTVKLGNYMGKNYGRIIKITPDELVILETIKDAEGFWEHKTTTLIPSADEDDPVVQSNMTPPPSPTPTEPVAPVEPTIK